LSVRKNVQEQVSNERSPLKAQKERRPTKTQKRDDAPKAQD